MKIKSIQITGFRGFAGDEYIDLNADSIIIVGTNGQGKTSFFDAILWGLTGNVTRLTNEDQKLVSLYSISGEARVCLELISKTGEQFTINRSFDGRKQSLTFERGGSVLRDIEAEFFLFKTLWPEALSTEDSHIALNTAITRSIYLQQDLVREFLESDDDQQRFKAVSELVGTGRITELQSELENSRNAWSRSLNIRLEESATIQRRADVINSRMNSLAGKISSDNTLENAWSEWWNGAKKVGLNITRIPSLGSNEASSAMDITIKQLQDLKRSKERKIELAEKLKMELKNRPSIYEQMDNESLVNRKNIIEKQLNQLQELLLKSQKSAIIERKKHLEIQQNVEEKKLFARLALRHLEDKCPVCGQSYDIAKAKAMLEGFISSSDIPDNTIEINKIILNTSGEIEILEKEYVELKARINKVTTYKFELSNWSNRCILLLNELGLVNVQKFDLQLIENAINNVNDELASIIKLKEQGEQLSLQLAQATEINMRHDLEVDLARINIELKKINQEIALKKDTYEIASRMIDEIRNASYFIVEDQLKKIEPVLKRIYAMIDPHPVFRDIGFIAKLARGKGRLMTYIDDKRSKLSSDSPGIILSSSQMNALAVSVFLSFNLSMSNLPVESVLLDDPLQSLDDINLLGLIDLFRKTKAKRQLIISTHDQQFGKLLERKLRPTNGDQRTLIVRLEGWNREGPSVKVNVVEPDLSPLRIAA
jgi:DNA repair exonuclease SbcCD ATPase subunit